MTELSHGNEPQKTASIQDETLQDYFSDGRLTDERVDS
jgi:hypothetical protein